jgi:hypothetical protein
MVTVLVVFTACRASFDDVGECQLGAVEACYNGSTGTLDVGICKAGTRSCEDDGTWSPCQGEVRPAQELCNDGVDNNCNGLIDEDEDRDGDGITTCAGDCCDSTECSSPELVNSGAFDAVGNQLDDDCNGVIDDGEQVCDQGLASSSQAPLDYAKALDLCQTTSVIDYRWGVLDAQLTLADGTGIPATHAHAIRHQFGTSVQPKAGSSLVLLSTGVAASKGDTLPAFQDFETPSSAGNNKVSPFPNDFLAAHGHVLPNTPGCPSPIANTAKDPVMLTLTIRVPTNAHSFRLASNFFSAEFPEYMCSPYNDFFVVLLDSTYAGTQPNPSDKNIAYFPATRTSIGVNFASIPPSQNTGLISQCVVSSTGCAGNPARPGVLAVGDNLQSCVGVDQLAGTGFDTPTPGSCSAGSLQGSGTGWMEVTGNVTPGEIIKLRIAIWDTSDHIVDSIAVIDRFEWLVETSQPGTVILRR